MDFKVGDIVKLARIHHKMNITVKEYKGSEGEVMCKENLHGGIPCLLVQFHGNKYDISFDYRWWIPEKYFDIVKHKE